MYLQKSFQEELFGTYLPQNLAHLEKLLKTNDEGKGFFVGDKVGVLCEFCFDTYKKVALWYGGYNKLISELTARDNPAYTTICWEKQIIKFKP